jgi:hypothetical protein
MKFVSDLRHRSFSPGTLIYSINKTDCQDITEILLKLALNIINHQNPSIEEGQTIQWPKEKRQKNTSMYKTNK